MNGQTNVQVSALAAFASVTILWLLGFFFPDLMATAPEMLGELFTAALIVAAGLIFKSDAGIKALPGTGAQSPVWIALVAVLLVSLGSGCAAQPRLVYVSDRIVTTTAGIETAADTILALCGNTEQDGECRPGASISTHAKNRLKDQLQTAQNHVVLANIALTNDNNIDAADRLSRAEALLTLIQTILQERSQ